MKIKLPKSVPETEWSERFIQAMIDAMGMSFFKYGPVVRAYPEKVNALACLKRQLDKYEKTGNMEYLVNVGNYAMIEFMRPGHPEAHYKPTDAHGSLGRKWNGEVNFSHRGNAEF